MADVEDLYRSLLFRAVSPLPDKFGGWVVIAGLVGFDAVEWVVRRVIR